MQGQQEPENDKSLLSFESIVHWTEGNNSDMEECMQIYAEVTGLDFQESELAKGQLENIDREITRAVEAKRKEQQGQRQESEFHRRGNGGARSARMARSDSWITEGERKKRS